MWFNSSVVWLRDHIQRHSSLFQKCPYCGKSPVVELSRRDDYFGNCLAYCTCVRGIAVTEDGSDCVKVVQRVIDRWNKLVTSRKR